MKKKLSTILTVLLIAMFTISTVEAGRGIKISSADFSLGSLIAEGTLTGTDQSTMTVVLEATGTCNNEPVSAVGAQILWGDEESATDERQFYVETNNPGGCSNDTEDEGGFVLWTNATISVYSGIPCDKICEALSLTYQSQASSTLLTKQDYNCATNQDAHTVDCTPVKTTVGICHATGSKKNPYVLITVNVNALNGHGKHAGDIIPAPANGCPN